MDWINNASLFKKIYIIFIPFGVIAAFAVMDWLWIWLRRKKHYELGYTIGKRGDIWIKTSNKYSEEGIKAGYKEYQMIQLLNK